MPFLGMSYPIFFSYNGALEGISIDESRDDDRGAVSVLIHGWDPYCARLFPYAPHSSTLRMQVHGP